MRVLQQHCGEDQTPGSSFNAHEESGHGTYPCRGILQNDANNELEPHVSTWKTPECNVEQPCGHAAFMRHSSTSSK